MASHDSKQPSSGLLWIIIPAAVLLTLLFVNFNSNAVDNKERLDGKLPEMKKVEMTNSSDTATHSASEEHGGAEEHAEGASHE